MKSKTLKALSTESTVNTAMAIVAAVRLESVSVEMNSASDSEQTAPATTIR